jgi:hypothetical protein
MMDTASDDGTDSLFLSESENENERDTMKTSSKSIYDIDVSNLNPEFMRIFNLTPPLEHSDTSPDTIIPYYIIIMSPLPRPFDTLSFKHGQSVYSNFVQTIESETLDILVWWLNQIDLDIFVKRPPYNFDELYKSYYVKPYTRSHPFTFYYFIHGKWNTYKLTSISKDKIFNTFSNNFHTYVVL